MATQADIGFLLGLKGITQDIVRRIISMLAQPAAILMQRHWRGRNQRRQESTALAQLVMFQRRLFGLTGGAYWRNDMDRHLRAERVRGWVVLPNGKRVRRNVPFGVSRKRERYTEWQKDRMFIRSQRQADEEEKFLLM